MAKTSLITKNIRLNKNPKFKTRVYHRCNMCGKPRSYMRKFGICRICFRQLASRGEIPGIKKDSW